MSNNTVVATETGVGVQSVDRALAILECLARLGEAGVTELAAELGVHKSTAFRLAATLESHRLVEQTTERGKYRLGVGILRLAFGERIGKDILAGVAVGIVGVGILVVPNGISGQIELLPLLLLVLAALFWASGSFL